MKKMTVTSVNKIAFDNEVVVMENDDMKVTVNIKNQKYHGSFEKGEKVSGLIDDQSKGTKTKNSVADKSKARESKSEGASTQSESTEA